IVGIIVVSIISFFAKSSIELKNAHKDVAALFAAGDSCMSVYDSCMSVYAWTEAKQYYYKALKYENIPNLDKQVEAKITKLKGKRGFSVDSSGKHVIFSKGNLQYQASTDTWRFALNQWDYVGDSIYGTVYENGVKCDNSKISSTYSGWIDLFGWGTGDKPTFSSGESWRYDIFSDWGENLTNGDTHSNKWKTLTMDEWEYLYQARTNASKLRSQATVNGVYGYIFLPDNWSLPSGMSFTADADDYATNNYSTTNWSKMESAGAVFLPSMGGTAATQMWTI
ncbi:MAG: hypothetical protein IJ756_03245, partial [Paludibacteraceae bacterium]|nr:hypothetical protein [Paludibacteraceae bacterium]